MSREDRIIILAIVLEEHKGGKFLLRNQDNENHKIIASLCGKMHISHIKINAGDEVSIEVSPYDLNKGRVLWRF